MKKSEKNKSTPVIDVEAHQKHLKRQLDSLEYDNHQSLNDVEGLISMALAVQEQNEEGKYIYIYIFYRKSNYPFLFIESN